MLVGKIKKNYQKVLVFLQILTPLFFVILVGSQSLILHNGQNWPLTTLSQVEGSKLEHYSEELMANDPQGFRYYLTLRTSQQGDGIKVLLDRQLIGVVDDSVKTISLGKGQELSLDGSKLVGKIDFLIEIGHGEEIWLGTFSLLPGGVQIIPWMEIMASWQDNGVNMTQ